MKEDNKDVKLLNEELWSKRMTAEIMMMERKQQQTKTIESRKLEEITPEKRKWSKY